MSQISFFLSLRALFSPLSRSLHLVPWILCQYLPGFLSITHSIPQSLSSLYPTPETDDQASLLLSFIVFSSLCSLPSPILSKTTSPSLCLLCFFSDSHLMHLLSVCRSIFYPSFVGATSCWLTVANGEFRESAAPPATTSTNWDLLVLSWLSPLFEEEM